jgi:signal transduction histidine kinase/integral membrane sensor domain MASE1
MSTTSDVTPSSAADGFLSHSRSHPALAPSDLLRTISLATATAVAYYATARLGRLLPYPGAQVSALWLPNAVLLAALLLSRRRDWWIFILFALPAHFLPPATPPPGLTSVHVLLSFALNCATALVAAFALQRFLPRIERIDRMRAAVGLLLLGGLLSGVTTSFLFSAVVAAFGEGSGHWLMPVVRALTNTFAILTVVPLLLNAAAWWREPHHTIRPGRVVEALLLVAVVAAVGLLAFVTPETAARNPAILLYAPFALLLWATVRFGVVGACGSMLLVGALACWGISRQTGPFVTQNALSVEVFLTLTSATLLMLAATLAERSALEREGRASETRFRTVFDHNIIPTVIYHTDGRVLDANDTFLKLTGYDRAALQLGQLQAGNLLRAHAGTAGSATPVSFNTSSGPIERELLLRDGRQVPVLVGGYLFPGSSRGTAYLFDLSSVRRAESERHQAEMLHWAVLASVHDQIVVLDQSGVVIEANQSWRRLLEDSATHAFEKADVGDHYVDDCERAAQSGDHVAAELLTGMRETLGGLNTHRRLEYALEGADASRWYEISIERLRRPEGGIVIRRTDITAQKQATEQARDQRQQLAHLGRAAVLGELSGAFAHELAQPLTSILGNAEAALQLLLREAGEKREIHEMLRDIIKDDIRAAELLKRLRSMLMRGEIQRQSVDINQVVRDVLALTRGDLTTRNVSVVTALDSQPCVVQADNVQLQQVLLNLIVNACEAMSDVPSTERRLTIATRPVSDSRAVECSVADCGVGIASADLERIFQPFVTSKKRGLGLGLPICRSIIEAHGGRLWAEPGVERGAVLRFTANTIA